MAGARPRLRPLRHPHRRRRRSSGQGRQGVPDRSRLDGADRHRDGGGRESGAHAAAQHRRVRRSGRPERRRSDTRPRPVGTGAGRPRGLPRSEAHGTGALLHVADAPRAPARRRRRRHRSVPGQRGQGDAAEPLPGGADDRVALLRAPVQEAEGARLHAAQAADGPGVLAGPVDPRGPAEPEAHGQGRRRGDPVPLPRRRLLLPGPHVPRDRALDRSHSPARGRHRVRGPGGGRHRARRRRPVAARGPARSRERAPARRRAGRHGGDGTGRRRPAEPGRESGPRARRESGHGLGRARAHRHRLLPGH